MPDRRRKGNQKALTVRLNPVVVERLKEVARKAAGMPLYATVAGMVEAGIITECDRIEDILAASFIDTGIEPKTCPGSKRIRRNGTEDNHRIDAKGQPK